MSSIYSIGVSALNAAQAQISTTMHNIANANTPGYSRQEVMLTSMGPNSTGAGYFGQGVAADNVVRHYDQFLGAQVLEAQTQASSLSTQLDLAKQVSNLLGDTSGGLTVVLADFFNGVNGVANAPQSVAARQAMLGSAQSLVDRLQTLNQSMSDIRNNLNGRISESVLSINSYSKQIAALNDQIVKLEATTPGQVPNDLLDQRDQLINQLSKEVRVSTVDLPDGSKNVYIGTGQSLVVGSLSATLKTVASATDPSVLDVAYTNNGVTSAIQQDSLQGGNLGAYLNFRATLLDPAVNALGRIAMGIADTFNQQQAQGIDLKGAFGGNMFTLAAPRLTPATSNTGTANLAVTIASTSALTAHDYSVKFDGTNYNVYDTSDNSLVQSFTPAALATAQTVTGTGLTLQLTGGAAVNGDSFLIRPTVDGARNLALNFTDPNKIAAASPVRSNAATTNLGSGVISAPTISYPISANLQQAITINFTSATTYTVSGTGAPGGTQTYTPGSPISINGWTVNITGTPATNDKFTVGANTNATADGTNILLMAGLQTANTLAGGTTSYQGAYGQMLGQVGSQTRELTVTSKAQTDMLTQINAAASSVSGVNLDEEAANLQKFQQAYQAAAKAMQIANTMFETLLNLK